MCLENRSVLEPELPLGSDHSSESASLQEENNNETNISLYALCIPCFLLQTIKSEIFLKLFHHHVLDTFLA